MKESENDVDTLDIDWPEDLSESMNNTVLLTGAGYSKDYGGYLANEIETKILNHELCGESIRQAILKPGGNYEGIYSELEDEKKRDFELILIEIFKKMDGEQKNKFDKNINQFLSIFQSEDKYNFSITLNQDLVLERQLINKREKNIIFPNDSEKYNTFDDVLEFNYPFVSPSLGEVLRGDFGKSVQNQKDYDFDAFLAVAKFEEKNIPKNIFINCIKVHGSANLQLSEGRNILITGTEKESDLLKYNLLKAQKKLLEKIMSVKRLNIVIVGYSFVDKHINEQIASSIEIYGSKLFIIDEKALNDFKKDIKVPKVIRESIRKYYDRGLDKFIRDQSDLKVLKNWVNDDYN